MPGTVEAPTPQSEESNEQTQVISAEEERAAEGRVAARMDTITSASPAEVAAKDQHDADMLAIRRKIRDDVDPGVKKVEGMTHLTEAESYNPPQPEMPKYVDINGNPVPEKPRPPRKSLRQRLQSLFGRSPEGS